MTIKESITCNANRVVKQPEEIILYQIPSLKFLYEIKYYCIDCLNENILAKKELISFIQCAPSVYRTEPYHSLLVYPGKRTLNISGCSVLIKVKFEKAKPLKTAFVSGTLYQSLLYKRFQILNNNIIVLYDKNRDAMTAKIKNT
ncbi:MAG: hypothetical protein ACXVNO_01530 [Bacteroidia bacterium]